MELIDQVHTSATPPPPGDYMDQLSKGGKDKYAFSSDPLMQPLRPTQHKVTRLSKILQYLISQREHTRQQQAEIMAKQEAPDS